ncbi:MAG: acyl-CoA oxidase [Myxococcales bacterium]|nr:acyl-CoA oxidase [Myxococcales bacterium]
MSFDSLGMLQILDGERAPLKRDLRRLLSEPAFRKGAEMTRAEHRARVFEWLEDLASRGYGTLGFPAAAGGTGNMMEFMGVFETLAHHDLSLLVKFGVQFGLFAGSISNLGTERHYSLLARAIRFEIPGCYAMTEIGHGSNVRDIETTAVFDEATMELVITSPTESAGKTWIGNAALHGRWASVFCQLEVRGESHGVHAVLVPIRDDAGCPLPGVRIEDNGPKMGLQGVDNGKIWFDGVRVPKDNLLDRFGGIDESGRYESAIPSDGKRFFTMLGTLVGGRMSIALAACSASKNALTIAIRHGSRRRQFGQPGQPETRILDYQTHQLRLMPLLARTYALHFAIEQLVTDYATLTDEDARRELESGAAGLKAFASWHCTETVQMARECCGGRGYASASGLPALKADTDIFTTFEGDNTVLMQLLARGLLAGYRRQFENLDVLSALRLARTWASGAVERRNPFGSLLSSDDRLRDAELHHRAFEARERDLLFTLARRIRKRLQNGLDPQEAVMQVQDHVLATGRAHVERVVHQAFMQKIASVDAAHLARGLESLRSLYGIWRLYEDRAWFIENGYFASGKSRSLRRELHRLVEEVRISALGFVDAFGIPDELLASDIGARDPSEVFFDGAESSHTSAGSPSQSSGSTASPH